MSPHPAPIPDPRRDPAALKRRNRAVVLILVAVAAILYFGIQLRWGGY